MIRLIAENQSPFPPRLLDCSVRSRRAAGYWSDYFFSNKPSIDERGGAESLGVLSRSPMETMLGVNNLQGGTHRLQLS